MSLKEQLADYRAGWFQRVPAERQAIMERHIAGLRNGAIAKTALKVGDRAPAIALENAKGVIVDESRTRIWPGLRVYRRTQERLPRL